MAAAELPPTQTRVIVKTPGSLGVRFAWTLRSTGDEAILSRPETSVRGTAGRPRAGATASGEAAATLGSGTLPRLPVLPHLGPPPPETAELKSGDILRLSWQSATQYLEVPVIVAERRPEDPPNSVRVSATAPTRSIQRRRGHRIGYHTSIMIEAADGTRHGTTKDLSEGGILLDLGPRAQPPLQGDVVGMRFAVDGRLVHLHGVVAHTSTSRGDVRRSDVGIRFVDAEGDVLMALRRMILASRVDQRKRNTALAERP